MAARGVPPAGSSSGKQIDVLVYGASGFTGCRVLKKLAEVAPPELRIAVGGRDRSKLASVLQELKIVCTCEVLVADIRDSVALADMTRLTRLVLNCVGPYRFWGEQMVLACIEGQAHYLDVCGEPEFIEKMEYKYNDAAKAAGVKIASAVGFDSVPADMGTLFAMNQFKAPSLASSVDSFLTIHAGPSGIQGHFPTWQCAVFGMASANELRALRSQAKREGKALPLPDIAGPKPKRISAPKYSNAVQAWALPFPGADASVVKRTQSSRGAQGKAAVHYSAMFTVSSRWSVFLFSIFGSVFQRLAIGSSWTRGLLLSWVFLWVAHLHVLGVFRQE